MKLIDRSPVPVKPEGLDMLTRVRGTLQYGASWSAEVEAQEACLKILKRYLKDSYYLLRNLSLSNLDVPIPMILVGPGGIYVLYISAVQGAFRAKGEDWLILQTGRGFNPTRPNLVKRAALMAQALDVYLKRTDDSLPDVQGVMLFMSPRVFVETVRPVVRVMMSDAVEKFVSGLAQAIPVLEQEKVEAIVEAITNPVVEAPPVEAPPEEVEPEPPPAPSAPRVSSIDRLASRINLTRKQWIILVSIAAILLCVSLAIIIYVAVFP